jgi:anaerobic magnesium-protoporphyrin IX monomethyl ester cyclase
MSRNEDMVKKMAEAGFKSLFLGIENASKKNLIAANKGDIVDASRKAVAMCHKYGIMVVGGLIFGFPDDDEKSIIQNYQFMKDIKADASFCQLLTPYPKTGMRQNLIDEGLVTNKTDYTKYNGLWANVKTRHLSSEQLQYFFWYYRQTVQGWWEPSGHARSGANRIWTGIWIYVFKPLLKFRYKRIMDKYGWEGRYRKDMERIANLNVFSDLNKVVKD